ncbi:carbohydrate ABC transporter permease [Candidatus Enterococcus clewellii]|uniref:ABC transmembrane type-1 domain-containing protein n=1 Tax=Candidatus Enterococcus clewellii TaxID=1834193 RepID=A0A242K981_9ENTE|nr:carbohydrate ABC transporter permease [Enterococcus sp. 9E7_DIV0242]OTP17516.1 hypothetical protein A5888_001654 [Enterococcus sp. 9E7_DIV0242]
MVETKGEKTFRLINYTILGIISLIALYPFVYVLSASISSPTSVVTGNMTLFPKDIRFDSYRQLLTDNSILIAYGNTIYYTIVGTITSMLLTILGAYALSKRRLRGKKLITIFITITMWFDAGMIPTYLNIKDLGLLDTRMAMIIAFACNTFNVILLRSFFESVPEELEEAALIDGAKDHQILWRIYLPLSKAALATVSLFYAISRWNGYFWAMVIIRDENKAPLQVLLKKLIVENSLGSEFATAIDPTTTVSVETITYATIVVSVIPIVLIYPFIQKYFVKGVMVGAVKG